MKILVDKLPETPKECLFSSELTSMGYVCVLRKYIEQIRQKPKCICKSVEQCDRLKVIGE